MSRSSTPNPNTGNNVSQLILASQVRSEADMYLMELYFCIWRAGVRIGDRGRVFLKSVKLDRYRVACVLMSAWTRYETDIDGKNWAGSG